MPDSIENAVREWCEITEPIPEELLLFLRNKSKYLLEYEEALSDFMEDGISHEEPYDEFEIAFSTDVNLKKSNKTLTVKLLKNSRQKLDNLMRIGEEAVNLNK